MDRQSPGQASNGDYSLSVENFGPIVSADVDFRPLTVFVGPSNTGKSYLAILVYALHGCFGASGFRRHRHERGYRLDPAAIESIKLNKPVRKSFAAWLSALREVESMPPLPEDVVAVVRPALEQPTGFDQYLEEEMLRCFGVEHHGELVRRPGTHTGARLGLDIPQAAGAQPVRYEFTFGQGTTRFSGRIPVDEPILIQPTPSDYVEDLLFELRRPIDQVQLTDRDRGYLLWLLADALFPSLVRPLTPDAFYLPADRTGVMHSHQVVVSALIQGATRAGLRPSHGVPALSGVLADFLDDLIGAGTPQSRMYRPKSSGGLAKTLEREILDGTVRRVRGETGYPTFFYRPRGWKDDLPLMRTSSMVSELAPVVLYLRHIVQRGDVLIIEEPEAHLHPAMQAAFARELARLVHAGVRIILTTHSEWFVEQIGNLVRLSGLPEGGRAGIPGADVALTPGQVGVWLFTPKGRPKGSVVEEVMLDPDTGIFPTGYDEVSEALYNEGAETFNRLQESVEA